VLENGNVLIFDNGVRRQWSRVVEVDPRSGRIVWEYRAPEATAFFTRSRGGAQRLPNGNTLITESNRGHAFEVTAGGEIVWDFFVPLLDEKGHRATLVRLYRYESAFVEPLLAR
jgi:outer membrane protein assembly factor BamB